jgi:fucose permease
MGVCNKMAGMIGVFIFGTILFSNMETISSNLTRLTGEAYQTELQMLSMRLISPYIVIAVMLCLLAVMVLRSKLPKIEPEEASNEKSGKSIFAYPYLWLGVIAIFAYVGAEVIAIDTLSLYGNFHGFSSDVAKNFSILSLIALTIGYFVGIALMPKYISQRTALLISCLLALCMGNIALFASAKVSICAIILLSFAHAMMWPCIFSLSIEGLGKHTKLGSAFLIMAVAGGAVLPLIYGFLAEATTRQIAYWILLPLYIYILFFGLFGCKRGKK